MLCNEISAFPNKVDEMTFFQDVSLNTIEYRNEYQGLLSKGRYSEAARYINRQNDIYGYFACFFNMLENRIYALQEYLLTSASTHEDLSEYSHEALSQYTYEELTQISSGKNKFNPIIHQSEIPEHAISGISIWTGGNYTNHKED